MKRLAVGITTVVFALGACSSGASPAPTGPATGTSAPGVSAAPTTSVLKVVQVNATTGQSAAFGQQSVNGIQWSIKQINDGGGFQDSCGNTYTIADTVFDMANDKEQAIAGLRQAADDPSVLVEMGATPSTGFVPMLSVAGQIKMPIISPGSGALVKEWNPYGFRSTVSSQIGDPAQMKLLKGKFNIDKVGVIYDISQDNERSGAELVRDNASAIGYEVSAFESFKAGDTDFRAQLTTIKATGVKWIGVFGAMPELTKITTQANELGIIPGAQLFGHAGIFADPKAWDLTNGLNVGAMTWTVAIDLASTDPEIKAFVDGYTAQFNTPPTLYSIYGVQALGAVVDAVKRSCSGTDREKFRDALATTDITVLGGGVHFDSPRDKPNGENLAAADSVKVVKVTGPNGAVEEVK